MLIIDQDYTPPSYPVTLIDGWHASVYADVPKGATRLPVAGTDLSTMVSALGTTRTYLRLWDAYREETVEAFIGADNTLHCTPTEHSYAVGVHVETSFSPAAMYGVLVNAIQHGVDGTDGTDGTDGAIGSLWLHGDAAPSNGNGRDIDMYLQSNGNVYAKNTGAWVLQQSLKGLRGDDGSLPFLHVLLSRNGPLTVTRLQEVVASTSTVSANTITGSTVTGGTITLPQGTYLIVGSAANLLSLVPFGDVIAPLGTPVVVTKAYVDGSAAATFSSFAATQIQSLGAFQDMYPLHGVVHVSSGTGVVELKCLGDWNAAAEVTASLAFYQHLTLLKVA